MARTGVWALPLPTRPSRPSRQDPSTRPNGPGRQRSRRRTGVTWRATAAVTADVLLLSLLLLGGLAVRLWVLGINDELNADESIPGLMARHILYEGERPVFFYGQHYFGAAEAYLIAGLFATFGFFPRLVTVPAIAASLLLIPVSYFLGRHLAGRTAGLLAALPVAFAPPIMAKLYANSGGGFSLAFLLNGVTLLAYLAAYLRPPGRPGVLPRAMLFSFLAGVLCWVWQPALALLPVLVPLLVWRQPSLRHPLRLLLALAPLAVGLAPPLAYNLAEGWPSVTQLARKYSSPLGWEAAPGIGKGPAAVGSLLLIAFGGGNEAEGGANPLQSALVAVAFPLTLVLLWRGRDAVSRRRLAAALVLALSAIVAALAAHGTVRHLAPVAHLGFAFAGAALVLLARRLLPRPAGLAEVAAGALAVGLLVLPNLYLDASAGWIFQRFVARESDVQTLVRALQERGLTAGYGDYWTAYPVTYLSGEGVAVAPRAASIWGERVDRYPPLTYRVEEVEDPRRAFLLLDDRCDPLPYLLPLEQDEATYRLERIARWYLIWDVQPLEEKTYTTLWTWYQVITFRSHC